MTGRGRFDCQRFRSKLFSMKFCHKVVVVAMGLRQQKWVVTAKVCREGGTELALEGTEFGSFHSFHSISAKSQSAICKGLR